MEDKKKKEKQENVLNAGIAGAAAETVQRYGSAAKQHYVARIVWNLVNHGYADSTFSKEEQNIVSYFAAKWTLAKDVFQEFIDTADTMLALTKQKEWIVSTFSKGINFGRINSQMEKERSNDLCVIF